MKTLTYLFVALLFLTTPSIYAQDFKFIKQDSVQGVILKVFDSSKYTFPFIECHVKTDEDTLILVDYGLFDTSFNYYINKSVKIIYEIDTYLKEVDMHIHDTSIYYDQKKADLSNTIQISGVFDIYDYGCAMPGVYYLKAKDSIITSIRHYVTKKYQVPHEGQFLTGFYKVDTFKFMQSLTILEPQPTLNHLPEVNPLDQIPQAFFDQTKITKESIAVLPENFTSGCVKSIDQKNIKLNYIKTNEKQNTQTISLSFGGKTLTTKTYLLRFNKKGTLKIRVQE